MTAAVPEKIQCKICSAVCKRGVRVGCCNTIACRSCATKSITTNRVCWNENCKTEVTTSQLINDENLRQQADKFSKGEEIDESSLVGMKGSAPKDAPRDVPKDDAPPVKKFKKSDQPKFVTMKQMRDRNSEFERCLVAQEKQCMELRIGAQLELMFEFHSGWAESLVTKDGEQLMDDNSVYQHLEEKHPAFLNNLKTILKPSGDLRALILKSVKAEFEFAEKQVFPCKVEI